MGQHGGKFGVLNRNLIPSTPCDVSIYTHLMHCSCNWAIMNIVTSFWPIPNIFSKFYHLWIFIWMIQTLFIHALNNPLGHLCAVIPCCTNDWQKPPYTLHDSQRSTDCFQSIKFYGVIYSGVVRPGHICYYTCGEIGPNWIWIRG